MSENIDRELLHRKIDVEIMKMVDESAKIRAETMRINEERRLHPWVPFMMAILGSAGFYALIGAFTAYSVAFIHH